MNYDQWKTASPYDDDAPEQTIDIELRDEYAIKGYGRRQHGMNGKDADLDRIGQFIVKELVTVDPIKSETLIIEIHCRLYASICPPARESLDDYRKRVESTDFDASGYDDDQLYDLMMEEATSVVCGMHIDTFGGDPMACMWDGDYWSGGVDVTLEVPLTVDEYEIIEDPDHWDSELQETRQTILDTVARRIVDEIYDSNKGGTPARDQVKLFEEEVGLANDLMNQISH